MQVLKTTNQNAICNFGIINPRVSLEAKGESDLQTETHACEALTKSAKLVCSQNRVKRSPACIYQQLPEYMLRRPCVCIERHIMRQSTMFLNSFKNAHRALRPHPCFRHSFAVFGKNSTMPLRLESCASTTNISSELSFSITFASVALSSAML